MTLDLFVKLKYESSTIILFVEIWYSMRDLLSDLNNYDWPANYRYVSDMVNDVSASSGISYRLSKLWIPFQNNLLDEALYKNVLYFHIFAIFSGFSNVILSDALILSLSQLQTRQVMTSQIRSHIEYLMQTYYILVLILSSKVMKNLAIMTNFNTI